MGLPGVAGPEGLSDPVGVQGANLYLGDCLERMKELKDNSVDTIITDPPYGLSFMGKNWDKGVPGEAFWKEMLRVAKPGAMLLSFGGTRTHHRLMCAIEDAGWEVRDCMMWLYSNGYPKNTKTCLKPAWEPIVVAKKAFEGTIEENLTKWGIGGFNIDECRIGTESTIRTSNAGTNGDGWGMGKNAHINGSNNGRFPANIILDEEAGTLLDEQSGISTSTQKIGKRSGKDKLRLGAFAGQENVVMGHNDSGGASRFFYCAKASKSERGEGNDHPTVKPQSLLRYLCKLTKTPNGGIVLDPFMGSGSTGIAALNEGRQFIGMELDPHYFDIAKGRITAI